MNQMFQAVAITVIPEASTLTDSAWQEVDTIIEAALSRRPRAVRRQLGVFLRLLDVYALARHGRRFQRLTEPARHHLLQTLERSRFTLLRKGVWGLRTLILMGYYARPAAAREIGYEASARGWARVTGGE